MHGLLGDQLLGPNVHGLLGDRTGRDGVHHVHDDHGALAHLGLERGGGQRPGGGGENRGGGDRRCQPTLQLFGIL